MKEMKEGITRLLIKEKKEQIYLCRTSSSNVNVK